MGDIRTVVSLCAKNLPKQRVERVPWPGGGGGDITIDIIAEISILLRFLKVAKREREKNNVHIFTIHEER